MSLAPAPAVAPYSPPRRPEVVPPRPGRPGNAGLWAAALLTALMVIAAVWQKRAFVGSGLNLAAPPAGAVVRTAKVTASPVRATLRLTGVTAAENFVSLITPQLRGSRADRLRDAASSPGASGAAAAASVSSAGAAGQSTAGSASAANGSAAFQSATTRFGGGQLRGSAGSKSAAVSQAAQPSTAMGAGGLGSAADSLPPSGGGGGNSQTDFLLVLQQAAKPGTRVAKGETVAEFDRQYMQLRLDDYRASVAQTEASLKKQKADLDIAREAHRQSITSAAGALEKARLDLKTIPVLSAIDAERAKLAFEEADARYRQLLQEVKFVQISQDAEMRNAELDLAQSRLELKRAETNGEKMVAKAPIDGLTVMQTTWRGGEFGQIREGDQLWPGQFFMQIVDPSSMIVNAAVNQADVEKLRLGQKALVRFEAYADLALPAHVVSIGAVAKAGGFRASWVKEVPVRLKLDRVERRVIPDLSVNAEILLAADERPPAVAPLGSLFREGPLDQAFVYVRQSPGWERRGVTVGLASNTAAVVRSGLRPGEVVALDRPAQFEPKPQGSE